MGRRLPRPVGRDRDGGGDRSRERVGVESTASSRERRGRGDGRCARRGPAGAVHRGRRAADLGAARRCRAWRPPAGRERRPPRRCSRRRVGRCHDRLPGGPGRGGRACPSGGRGWRTGSARPRPAGDRSNSGPTAIVGQVFALAAVVRGRQRFHRGRAARHAGRRARRGGCARRPPTTDGPSTASVRAGRAPMTTVAAPPVGPTSPRPGSTAVRSPSHRSSRRRSTSRAPAWCRAGPIWPRR